MNKRILYVINVDWFFLSHRLPIALEMQKKGYEVHLALKITSKLQELKSHGFIVHDINFARKGTNIFSEIRVLYKLLLLVKKIKPTLCHLVTAKGIVFGGLVCKFLEIPCVAAFSGLGNIFSSNSFSIKILRPLILIIYKFIFSREDVAAIFQNKEDLEQLESLDIFSNKNIYLIKGSGIDLDKFSFNPELNIIPRVILVSRLLKQKGIIEFLKAASEVLSKGYKVNFIVYGEIDKDNLDSISQKDIDDWSKVSGINFAGFRDDINQILSESHILVLPSYYGEGLPKTLIEGASSGRAIITTDHAGCRDAIIPNKTGLLVPIKTVTELAQAITYLLDNSDLRREFGKEGRKYAEQEFSIEKVILKHLDIYADLIQSAR